MKFSLRFWTMVVLMSSVLIACSQTSEDSPSAANPAPAAQPSTPEPAKTDAAPATPAVAPNSDSTKATPTKSAGSPAPAKAATPPEIVSVPSGTVLTVVMIDAVATDTNKVGDTFTASLGEPVTVKGKTVLAKGTKVQGRIESLDEPGRVKGKAALSLVLTQLTKGKTYRITTDPFSAEADAGTKKDAVKVGGGAAIGALVGAIAGGKKGAAIGAGVGGGAGTAAVLATKGQQLRIDSETKVNFVLKNPVEIEMTKPAS